MADSGFKIGEYIYSIRGHRIILSSHLAYLYDVPVKRLNEQVKRNFLRFPDDFAFKLTSEEWANLQLSSQCINLKSQIATSRSHGGARTTPWAFTEYGVIQAASVLKAVETGGSAKVQIGAKLLCKSEKVNTRRGPVDKGRGRACNGTHR